MNAHILIVDDESRVTSALQRTLTYECYTVSTADTFNAMLVNLKEAYERQQRFIADASHELRAPITSIRCNLDLLAKAPDLPTEEVQAALADARTEAGRMGRLVSDLLLLAHTEATEQARQADHGGANDYRNIKARKLISTASYSKCFVSIALSGRTATPTKHWNRACCFNTSPLRRSTAMQIN
jgi:signal transduction histidine kinase